MDEIKKQITDYFDSIYDQYYSRYYVMNGTDEIYPGQIIRHNLILELLENEEKGKILDVGCGTGVLTCELLKRNWEVTSIDISSKMVGATKERIMKNVPQFASKAQIYQQDIEENSIKPESYNAIVLSGLIEYVSSDIKTLNIISKGIRKGGVAIITCRNKLFNLFSMNEYTTRTVMKGEYLGLLEELTEYFNSSTIQASDLSKCLSILLNRLPNILKYLKETNLNSPENKSEKWQYPMARRQHSLKEIRQKMASANLISEQEEFWHFHIFPSFLFDNFKPIYNDMCIAFEELRHSSLAPLCCSAFLVKGRKS